MDVIANLLTISVRQSCTYVALAAGSIRDQGSVCGWREGTLAAGWMAH